MGSDDTLYGAEAGRLLHLDDDELYSMLLPTDGATQVFSPKARPMRGRHVFDSLLAKARPVICDAYSTVRDDLPQLVALVSVLAASLGGSGLIPQAVAVPFCILVVRHGLDTICPRPPRA